MTKHVSVSTALRVVAEIQMLAAQSGSAASMRPVLRAFVLREAPNASVFVGAPGSAPVIFSSKEMAADRIVKSLTVKQRRALVSLLPIALPSSLSDNPINSTL